MIKAQIYTYVQIHQLHTHKPLHQHIWPSIHSVRTFRAFNCISNMISGPRVNTTYASQYSPSRARSQLAFDLKTNTNHHTPDGMMPAYTMQQPHKHHHIIRETHKVDHRLRGHSKLNIHFNTFTNFPYPIDLLAIYALRINGGTSTLV